MITAIVAAIASIVVAVLSVVLPRSSAKHQRELALLELEMARKINADSATYAQLSALIAARVNEWEVVWNGRFGPGWLIPRIFALAFACVAAFYALSLPLEPAKVAGSLLDMADLVRLPIGVAAVAFIFLACVFMIVWMVEAARGRRRMFLIEKVLRAEAASRTEASQSGQRPTQRDSF